MINPCSEAVPRLPNPQFNRAGSPLQADPAADRPAQNLRVGIDALYMHVPFCFHKCHYCDFYSVVHPPSGGQDRQEAFTEALVGELHHQAGLFDLRPRTIFVGGGTPTLLGTSLWQRVLAAMAQTHVSAPALEFTVEANPETVAPALIELLASGGVNRLSIGAQSFQPRLLEALQRHHDPDSVPRAMATARRNGITNINLDLIFAIPGQTLQDLDADLSASLALAPTHISCYNLTYEPNTALTTKLKLGRLTAVSEAVESDMYAFIMSRLERAGYEHYEISNWAKRQTPSDAEETSPYRCEHNLHYWRSANWIGLGPAAASHVAGSRWRNEPHLGRYIAGSPCPPTVDREQLPPQRRVGEHIMLGLRMREGIALGWLSEQADDSRHRTIDEFVRLGMLERTATHLRLSHEGLFVADALIGRLL